MRNPGDAYFNAFAMKSLTISLVIVVENIIPNSIYYNKSCHSSNQPLP